MCGVAGGGGGGGGGVCWGGRRLSEGLREVTVRARPGRAGPPIPPPRDAGRGLEAATLSIDKTVKLGREIGL